MSKANIEVDCTRKCKSRQHGFDITSAITKRSVSDEALASFVRATCANFTQAFDNEGRTALHMAASRGRHRLMEWLVRNSSVAFINARDRESGATSLHRSIFYGQIHAAVNLIKIGVNTDIVDKDDYRAIEHAMLDRQYIYKHVGIQPCDVYVWGSNSNYTLGTGTQQQKKMPDLLNCFSRITTSVQQVCLGRFHSVWVCGGEAWACGQAARTGVPAAGTLLRPTPLRMPEPCVQAAVTVDSTIFLLQSGSVIQYGLSDTNSSVSQSNVKSLNTIKLPPVKPVLKLSEPLGICSSRVHAVVWNKRAIYTWGTNLGQLGHSQPADKVVDVPKRVAVTMNNKEEVGVQYVAASDAGTVFSTSRGDVYLLHKHICKKIAIKQINLKQVSVDARVNESGVYSRVTVLMLNNVGQIMLWQDSGTLVTRCIFGLNHETIVMHATVVHNAIYFTTRQGEAFVGHISHDTPTRQATPPRKERDSGKKSSLVKFLEKDDCTMVRVRRIPNIHRAVSIVVDSEGHNFACLQIKPSCGQTSVPELSPSSLPKHMETLLEVASEDDLLHDVLFKIGTRLFPAHMFIVAAGSEHLYKLYQDQKLTNGDEKPTIALENVHPEVFERVLRYLYTGTCDVTQLGPCGLKIRREDLIADSKREKESPEIELDLIDNPLEVSAFEVYKHQGDRNKKSAKNRARTVEPRVHMFCDPVKLLQATAKRLQVMSLHKLLDKYYYREGTICLKDSATESKNPAATWERNSFEELVDTTVCSKDGVLISAHKCVLAARLEYFSGMFMHSWTESKIKSTVTLPVNHMILLPIINFLYTDTCPEVENSESIDFVCSLLIVADQLFVTRLREMCEVALANLVNLKNCTELCQFAHTYNATQLKRCCMEFISLNICALLENRSLEILNEVVLEDITKYYCKVNKIMGSRVITPFYNAINDEIIHEYAKLYPADLDSVDESLKKEDTEVIKKKGKYKKIEYTESEKARMRYESVSSVNSLDLSNENSGDITLALSKIVKETEKSTKDKQEKWIEIPTSQQKQQKLVQARLKAISSAKDLLNEPPAETYTKLKKNIDPSTPINLNPTSSSSSIPTSSRMSVSPKDSFSYENPWKNPQSPLSYAKLSPKPEDSSYESTWKNTPSPIVISHVGAKLSQKQRKKLALQGDELATPQNFDDYFTNRLSISESSPSKPIAPRNPWKMNEVPQESSSPRKPNSLEFNQILADQRKQKDDLSRIMTKPLNLTQLEDKAIEELERFYNVHQIDEELISVRRIELTMSSPQWLHSAPK